MSTRWAADSVMSESLGHWLGALYGRAVTPPSPGPAALRFHPVRQRKRCRNWPGTRLAEGWRLTQGWRLRPLRGRRGGRTTVTTQSPDLMGLDRGAECRRNCPGNEEEVREEPGLSRRLTPGPRRTGPQPPTCTCGTLLTGGLGPLCSNSSCLVSRRADAGQTHGHLPRPPERSSACVASMQLEVWNLDNRLDSDIWPGF